MYSSSQMIRRLTSVLLKDEILKRVTSEGIPSFLVGDENTDSCSSSSPPYPFFTAFQAIFSIIQGKIKNTCCLETSFAVFLCVFPSMCVFICERDRFRWKDKITSTSCAVARCICSCSVCVIMNQQASSVLAETICTHKTDEEVALFNLYNSLFKKIYCYIIVCNYHKRCASEFIPVYNSEQVFCGVCCRCVGQQVIVCFLCYVEDRILIGWVIWTKRANHIKI